MPKPIYQIVAVARNRVIGRKRKLPWSIPEEWRYFIETTRGGTMVMGRVCAEEFAEALPGRAMIAITHRRDFSLPGFGLAHSIEEALQQAEANDYPGPIWVCGGEQIYLDTLERTQKLYVSFIHQDCVGDTYFPRACLEAFPTLLSKSEHLEAEIPYTICIMGR